MDPKHGLMYVLSAIVLLNVIAIVLLNNRLAAQEQARQPVLDQQGREVQEPAPEPIVVTMPKPLVRTLVLEDTARCPDCFDVRLYAEQLSDMLNMSLEDADPAPFGADVLPALAFSATIEEYPPDLVEGWDAFGYTVAIPDGAYAGKWYVLPTRNPPFIDTRTGDIRGRVTVTYVTMASCGDCYDVLLNRAFLEESRITPYAERTVDAESANGKALLAKYNITAVPTIILSKDADEYASLRLGWQVVGTVEDDGSYVLRNLQRLKVTYYDRALGEVMRP